MNYKRALYYKSPVMTGDDVKHVQDRLKKLGYYEGSIDGLFGPGCKQAVIEFQRTNSLTIDGSIGPATWNVLFSNDAHHALSYTRALYYTSPVMTGKDVASVQRRLNWLGFYDGEIDGSFGPSCDLSTKNFQRANGLGVDGSVGPATYQKLFSNSVNTSVQYKRPLYYTTPTMKGDDVTHVQNKLKVLGYYNGNNDGSFGPSCKQAVMDFQRKNGLEIDGSVGPATWNAIFSNTSTGQSTYKRPLYYTSPVMKGDDVVTVQKKLKEKGYYTGEIDGFFGPACDIATKNFQRANGLEVDGSVGPATWRVLFSGNSNSPIKYTRPIYYTSPIMKGDDVKHVQIRLTELNYYNGGIDGSFGPGCKQAVMNFQKDKGLDADGSVGPATWEKLFNDSISVEIKYTRPLYYTSPTMKGDDVKHVQSRLRDLGFYGGAIDGSFGLGCKEAVMDFQRGNKLTIDGSIGPATWNALFGLDLSGGLGNLGNIKKVFIDPGHGGSDSGAVGNSLKEKDIALSIALKVGNLLKSKGISVAYSRTTDTYLSLESRAQKANSWGADLFVSIHCNSYSSSSASGTECFTYTSTGSSTKSLSKNVANGISKNLSLTNRGHKEANFAVLRLTNMPAILVETAFISNSSDANKLKSRQDDFANSIASQIVGSSIELPDDTKQTISYASKNGLFLGLGLEIETYNSKTDVHLISIMPKVTMQAELSRTTKFSDSSKYEVLNLSLSSEEIATTLLNDIGAFGLTFGYKENLKMSMDRLRITQNINKNVKYYVQDKLSYMEITFEASTSVNNKTVYQRLIFKVDRPVRDFVYQPVNIPVESKTTYDIKVPSFNASHALLAVGMFGALIYVSGATTLAGCTLIPFFMMFDKD